MSAILVLTGYNDKYAIVGDATWPSWQAYADYHNYDFSCVRNYPDANKINGSWHKLQVVKDALRDHEWVFWVDADAVCTNYDIQLTRWIETCAAELHVSRDWFPSNSGNFSACAGIWHAGHMTTQLISLAELKTQYINKAYYDQTALQEVLVEHPELKAKVKVWPRRELAAVPSFCWKNIPEPWQPGDFLAHLTVIKWPHRQQSALEFRRQYPPPQPHKRPS